MAEQLKDRKTNPPPRHRLSKVNPPQVEFSKLKKRDKEQEDGESGWKFSWWLFFETFPNLSSIPAPVLLQGKIDLEQLQVFNAERT